VTVERKRNKDVHSSTENLQIRENLSPDIVNTRDVNTRDKAKDVFGEVHDECNYRPICFPVECWYSWRINKPSHGNLPRRAF